MWRFTRPRLPSPAMVVACLALVLALGGTSLAAVKLGKSSVGSRELKKNAVQRSDIKPGAVDSSKVADNSLTGKDILEAQLQQVPSAATAGNALHAGAADTATRAGVADALTRVVYRTTTATVGPAPLNGTASTESDPTSAHCDPGMFVVGGGVKLDDNMSVVDAFPDLGGTAWTARAANDDTAAAHTFTVFAVCVTATTIG